MCAFGYLLFFALLLTTILVLSIIFATTSKRSMLDSFVLVFNYTQEHQPDQEMQQQQQPTDYQQQPQMFLKQKIFWVPWVNEYNAPKNNKTKQKINW